jgi:hypothetical protein
VLSLLFLLSTNDLTSNCNRMLRVSMDNCSQNRWPYGTNSYCTMCPMDDMYSIHDRTALLLLKNTLDNDSS